MADIYGNKPRNAFGGTNDTGVNQLQALAEMAVALGGQPRRGQGLADRRMEASPRDSAAFEGEIGLHTGDYGPMGEGVHEPLPGGPGDLSLGLAIQTLEKGGRYVIGEDPVRDEAARKLLDRFGFEYETLADGFNQLEAKVFGRPVNAFGEGSEVDTSLLERLVAGW